MFVIFSLELASFREGKIKSMIIRFLDVQAKSAQNVHSKIYLIEDRKLCQSLRETVVFLELF